MELALNRGACSAPYLSNVISITDLTLQQKYNFFSSALSPSQSPLWRKVLAEGQDMECLCLQVIKTVR
jgi:hypothetical protein